MREVIEGARSLLAMSLLCAAPAVVLAQSADALAQPDSLTAPAQPAVPVRPGELSPQMAVVLAVARHPEIHSAEATVLRRQAEVALAQSSRWPTISYGVGPGWGSSYGGGKNQTALRGNVGVDQPVWDFGATTRRIEAARDMEQAAQSGRDDTVEKVAERTLAAYADASVAQQRLTATGEAIEAMRRVEQRIALRVQAGLSNRSDLNVASSAVRRVSVDAEQARMAADAALVRLVGLIGVSPEKLPPLQSSYALLATRSQQTPDFDQAPAIRSALSALDATGERVRQAEAERKPAIGFGVNRTFSTGPYSANDSTWVGLTLRGNFSLGGAGRERVGAARADREAAWQDLESRRLEASTGWRVAVRSEAGARQRFSELGELATVWGTTRDLYWNEYILDRRSLGEVINAEREIYSAKGEQVAALGEAFSAATRALVAQGGLIAHLQDPERNPQ